MTDPTGQPGPLPPPGPGQSRPSESERRAAAERLRVATDEGRLDRVEYDQRLRVAQTAPTMAELDRILADLPVPVEPILVQIGELVVTRSTVHTPVGPIPLRGSQWTVQDQWLTERKTPTWAIVLAIVGFFCIAILSLLFLLAKETRFHGTVDVAITNGRQQYVARIPVHSQQQVQHIYAQVNYVRALTNL